MIGEFINMDLRPIAAILFGVGVGILAIYYSVYFRKDRIDEKKEETNKKYE
jgi:hypothetical protein